MAIIGVIQYNLTYQSGDPRSVDLNTAKQAEHSAEERHRVVISTDPDYFDYLKTVR